VEVPRRQQPEPRKAWGTLVPCLARQSAVVVRCSGQGIEAGVRIFLPAVLIDWTCKRNCYCHADIPSSATDNCWSPCASSAAIVSMCSKSPSPGTHLAAARSTRPGALPRPQVGLMGAKEGGSLLAVVTESFRFMPLRCVSARFEDPPPGNAAAIVAHDRANLSWARPIPGVRPRHRRRLRTPPEPASRWPVPPPHTQSALIQCSRSGAPGNCRWPPLALNHEHLEYPSPRSLRPRNHRPQLAVPPVLSPRQSQWWTTRATSSRSTNGWRTRALRFPPKPATSMASPRNRPGGRAGLPTR
jgi:hypothetical protein